MNELYSNLLELIKKRWPRRSTLLLLVLLALLIMLIISSNINFQKISWIHLAIFVAVLFTLISIWYFSNHVTKTPKRKIGFGLAIDFETKEQTEKIVSDFVTTLRDLMQKGKFRYPYHFIVFSQYHSEKIKSADDAAKYLKSYNLKYLIWGRARTRTINGKVNNVLDLDGMVHHRSTNPQINKLLSKEFSEIFPRRVIIESENDIFSFEFTAEWMHLVATYIIGIAALITGDLPYSQELFEYLFQEVQHINSEIPAIIKIRQRLPSRLSDVYTVQTVRLLNEWSKTKDINLLKKAIPILDKWKTVDPPNSDAHISRSIILFVLNCDVVGAKKELEKCRAIHANMTWRYNYAFLLAYEGNLEKAFSEYTRAFKGEIPSKTLTEIESFILWILDREPNKTQLYFLLGLLYFRKLKNISQAITAHEKFITNSPKNLFKEQKRYAQNQIIFLKKQIK